MEDFNNFLEVIRRIAAIGYPIAIFIGFIMIIKAGYTYMSSEGNPRKVKDATADLIAAITGVFFVVLSGIILNIIIRALLGF